jgi:hypothetical protein
VNGAEGVFVPASVNQCCEPGTVIPALSNAGRKGRKYILDIARALPHA